MKGVAQRCLGKMETQVPCNAIEWKEGANGIERRSSGCGRTVLLLLLTLIGLCASGSGQERKPVRASALELMSSDGQLVASFHWAKQQALAYVFDGDPVGPWYEASLPGRRAFCMRDLSHQAAGAHALGLSKYTHNMLRQFAKNIAASRDWCSYWEIDYRGQPAPVDYKNDQTFWYNLPANFDVMDACFRMYLWTGDKSYIADPVFLNFYDRTVTDYVSRWDLSVQRIMTRKNTAAQPPFYRGDPSYEESRSDMELGVDLLATQYAGYRAYARMQAIRGNRESAALYLQNSKEIKNLINTRWWSNQGYFYSYLDNKRQFQGRAGSDLLYRNATDDGAHTRAALDALLEKTRTESASAVEPRSHYAETLYRYGEAESAYAQIMDLTRQGRERKEYPEVSYSVIGALVNGMMGINIVSSASTDAVVAGSHFETVLETLPQLTSKTPWVELRNLPVGAGFVEVKEDNQSATLVNRSKTALTWQASFTGQYPSLLVNGKPQSAQQEMRSYNRTISSIRVVVAAGASVHVEAPR